MGCGSPLSTRVDSSQRGKGLQLILLLPNWAREEFSFFSKAQIICEMFSVSLKLRTFFISLIITVRKRTKPCQVTYYEIPMNSDADSIWAQKTVQWSSSGGGCGNSNLLAQEYSQVSNLYLWPKNILCVDLSVYALTLTPQPCRAPPSKDNYQKGPSEQNPENCLNLGLSPVLSLLLRSKIIFRSDALLCHVSSHGLEMQP